MPSEKKVTESLQKFWLRDMNGHPVTLIAYKIDDKGMIMYTTATQHPNDPRPDLAPEQRRKLPHLIVEGRMKPRKLTSKRHFTLLRHDQRAAVAIALDMLSRAATAGRMDTRWAGAAMCYVTSHATTAEAEEVLYAWLTSKPQENARNNSLATKRTGT